MESEAALALTAETKTTLLSQAMIFNIGDYSINLISLMIILIFIGILALFVRIQMTQKLDFADMLTKNGRSVSLTKVLQLVGGLTATWVVIKLAMTGSLNEAIFAIYLTYVASVEGFSKFVAAKYGYDEKSVKDQKAKDVLDSQEAENK